METEISSMVERFERGKVSRRDLVAGLTALAAAGAATTAQAQTTPFVSTGIDHISIQVTNLDRSIAFYRDIFGLEVRNRDDANKIVRMGRTRIIVSLHEKPPTGIVDHYAIAIEGFNRDEVTAALAGHGLTAEQNLDYGFYVRDPEGVPVQIVGG
jgi:catechol 2,3-dioxygenase-like lactoylglutathione lyase family enzyme